MRFPQILGLLFGRTAEPADADPDAVRMDKDKSAYLIPASRLMALVENVTLSENELKKTAEERILTERDMYELKFDKIARLIERCSDDREGEERIILQRLARNVREIGASTTQSGDMVTVPVDTINNVLDFGSYITETEHYFETLNLPDRSNVRNLRDDNPQIFFSAGKVASPLDGLDEMPSELSQQIGNFREAWKKLLPDIIAVRPAHKLSLNDDLPQAPRVVDPGFDL